MYAGSPGPEIPVGSQDNNLYVINSQTGQLFWKFLTQGPVDSTPVLADIDPNIQGLELVFGSDDGNLYLLNANGAQLWSFPIGMPLDSSPVIVDLNITDFLLNQTQGFEILTGSDTGNLYLFSKGGVLLWNYSTQGAIDSTPAIGEINHDGNLEFLVGSNDNSLYSFGIVSHQFEISGVNVLDARAKSGVLVTLNATSNTLLETREDDLPEELPLLTEIKHFTVDFDPNLIQLPVRINYYFTQDEAAGLSLAQSGVKAYYWNEPSSSWDVVEHQYNDFISNHVGFITNLSGVFGLFASSPIDFIAKNISLSNSNPTDNEEIIISITIEYLGNLSNEVNISLYILLNATNVTQINRTVLFLANEEKAIDFNWTSEEGIYPIIAAVDPADEIPELNEFNNGLSTMLFVSGLDSDLDNVPDSTDNCPMIYNPTQDDSDVDSLGDACDLCIYDAQNDFDNDSLCASDDNCDQNYNPEQNDTDIDAIGDVCDNCPNNFNPLQYDSDSDGIGDACEQDPCQNADITQDGNVSINDLSILAYFWHEDSCSDINNYCSRADINRDGVVDILDLSLFSSHWEQTDCLVPQSGQEQPLSQTMELLTEAVAENPSLQQTITSLASGTVLLEDCTNACKENRMLGLEQCKQLKKAAKLRCAASVKKEYDSCLSLCKSISG